MRIFCVFFLSSVLLMAGSISPQAASTPSAAKKKQSGSSKKTTSKPPQPVSSDAALLFDPQSGRLLYSKNIDQRKYPASTTKIMTALMIIEKGNLDQFVTIQASDTRAEPSKLDLQPGEKFTRRQLLHGLMIKSANDAALALARDHSGSVEKFMENVNRRLAQLGCRSSHFTNPNGLPNPNHYCTVRDMLRITAAAMKNPTFRSVVSTKNYKWTGKKFSAVLVNHNKLLGTYHGTIGVKTGWTIASKHTLVTAVRRGNRELWCVCFGGTKQGILEDTKWLFNRGFNGTPKSRI